ncbi:MAG: type 2 lanthipeptide synthetase LanM [Rhodospirillaceae bacterium]
MSEALLRHWRDTLGTEGLERRLAWAEVETSRPTAMPAGGEALLAAALAARDASARPGCLDPAAPVPFEELLVPFLAAACGELEQTAGSASRLFAPAALAGLERGLLLLLSHLALPVFASEFGLRRALSGRLTWLERGGATSDYRSFIAAMRAEGYPALLADYPGLAGMLTTAARSWAAAHGRLMLRFDSDRLHLRTCGLVDGDGRVEGLVTHCSDPHDGGQSVAILSLEGGRALVYKPRPVDMEDGLLQMLAWANRAGFPWPYRLTGLQPRSGYGWMEHVAAAPCRDENAVEHFYARSGGLFCLWWLLQGTDMHHENLIASGEHPVIVDAETLLHPRPSAQFIRSLGPGAYHGDEREEEFARALRESGFLPTGMDVDLSCWGIGGTIATPFAVSKCHGINSDAMTVEAEPFQVAPRFNLPMLKGRIVPAAGLTSHGVV